MFGQTLIGADYTAYFNFDSFLGTTVCLGLILLAALVVAVAVTWFVRRDKMRPVVTVCVGLMLLYAVAVAVANIVKDFKEGETYTEDYQAVLIAIVVILVVGIAILFALIDRKQHTGRAHTMSVVYAAVCIALAFGLSYVKMYDAPYGGSVTLFSLLPIALYSYMFGVRKGVFAGVIYGILHKSLAWAGRSRPAAVMKAVLTIAAAGFFTAMTGASPSVVRAFLFILINEISRLLPGRRRRPLAVLCAALMIQLAADPMIIRSLSFQLSYLAMLAIFTLFPVMESWYPESGRRDPFRKLWSAAALSISCQLYTAPLAWWHFRTFPAYFLISNLVALPISEVLIISSVITVAAEAAGILFVIASGMCAAAFLMASR